MKKPIAFALQILLIGILATMTGCPSQPTASPPQISTPNEAASIAQAPELLDDELLDDGWIQLFDGATLFGWQPAGEANWHVEDGSIVVSAGDVGLLCTTTQFSDYVLSLGFKSAEGTNSGIFLHTPQKPDDPSRDCYELNIAPPDNPFPTGSLVGRKKVDGEFESADWQTYEVTVLNDKVTITLDGAEINSYTDPNPLNRGFIGLQHNQGAVAFRDIRIKPLHTDRIFNGNDLEGWKPYPDMKSVFSVTDAGELNVKDGRGQLETADSYGDFVLQLECYSNGKHLNSGIFFRCIPGEVMMGYESQIQNGFKDGDRSQPTDCGTGGIFRRQNARWVCSDDFKWFHKTLIADGPHIAVWVNGYQVSDWTDTRAPHDNPRKGLRLEPGTIMIQGHDPTTDLSFRNIQIAEIRRRQERNNSFDSPD